MELSKYNKLEKLGFTFWNKRHDDEIQLESYLIGGSALAICTSSNLDFNFIERERFITSMAYFVCNETVKKINDPAKPYINKFLKFILWLILWKINVTNNKDP